MKTAICKDLGIEFPLFAFSHCRDVVAAVTNAGGMGVLGAVGYTPETLDADLGWIDEKVNGRPYGVDLLIPGKMAAKDGTVSPAALEAMIPPEHRRFTINILERHGINTDGLWSEPFPNSHGENLRESGAEQLLDVAFRHPIALVVNALGVPPRSMFERARKKGIPVGALTGAREHAIRHAQAGVDILIVSGTEGGGHCGEISTMVLVPEVLRTMEAFPHIRVLAAGGIATGRQMAACMAMGADGVWTGSIWLTTAEAETTPTVKQKMLAANSSDTIRSRSRTGKYTRQLRSPWTDAWQSIDAPAPLPMPLQGLVAKRALARIDRLAEGGHPGAQALATYYVGQAVGLMNTEQSARSVVYDFMRDYADAVERLSATLAE